MTVAERGERGRRRAVCRGEAGEFGIETEKEKGKGEEVERVTEVEGSPPGVGCCRRRRRRWIGQERPLPPSLLLLWGSQERL